MTIEQAYNAALRMALESDVCERTNLIAAALMQVHAPQGWNLAELGVAIAAVNAAREFAQGQVDNQLGLLMRTVHPHMDRRQVTQ
jgi:hypothetical protein